MGALGRRSRRAVRLILACAAAQLAAFCRADIVTLDSGGVVRGRVVDSSANSGRRSAARQEKARLGKTVTVATLTGGRVVLDSSIVRNIEHRSIAFEEFEMRNRQTPDDIDSLRSLADWCRDRGLKPQREATLRRILTLDPDNVQAHQALGEVRFSGQWKSRDEEMRSRGFVKFEGKYVAPQEIEILKNLRARRKVESQWTERIRSFIRAMTSGDPERRRRGRTQLLSVSDPHALPGLKRVLGESDNEEVRDLYINVVGRIAGSESTAQLVHVSLTDPSQSVRVTAQETITSQHRPDAAPLYAHELRNKDNEIVRRAGMMLAKTGDQQQVPDLIEALITKHDVPMVVQDDSQSLSFSRNGMVSNPNVVPLPPDVYAKLVTGQYPNGVIVDPPPSASLHTKTVMVPRDFHNAEVLAALETLTRQSFGYDKNQWRRWWAERTITGAGIAPRNP